MSIIELKNKISPILKGFGVSKAGIFGSAARGDIEKANDIDILVEIPRRISLLDFIDLKFKLEDSLSKKVDLVEYEAIKPYIKDKILSEQVSII